MVKVNRSLVNLKILRPPDRAFRFTSPWERSELPFSAVPGEVKYKISVFGTYCQNETGNMPLWLTSRMVSFKKFSIWTALFLGAVLLSSFGNWEQDTKLQEKVDSAILQAFEIEGYTQVPIELDALVQNTGTSKARSCKVMGDTILLGYAYVGEAPSMKRIFDYIVLFNPDLTIKKAKVLIYREDHGRQIGSQRWLQQFIGMNVNDTPNYGENIDAISGATISAKSMTKAVGRVLVNFKKYKEQEI